ncbi:MAG: hypothetical protein M3371_08135 [Acidobacteriota bacterium]|nr:hypothetical protein [Acidobacteriota bacterium]
MKSGDYRREYAAYRTACERARYDFLSGAAAKPDFAPLAERYSDLWTRAAVADLVRAHAETPEQFETERTALNTLAQAARLGYAQARAGEVVAELAHCEEAVRVEWDGVQRELREVAALIANESDTARRRELVARWLDEMRVCDDLHAARFEALNEASRTLDCDNYFVLLSGAQRDFDAENLLASTGILLRQTEDIYNAHLSGWATRFLPPTAARELTYAESLFFRQLPHLEIFFPARDLVATYRDTLAGLGIRIEQQTSLQLEEVSPRAVVSSAQCCALSPPEDVRLLYRAQGGAHLCQDFFHEAGRAQQFAWASRELAARHPELVRPPSETTGEANAFLFRFLLCDAAWIGERRGVKPAEARAIARAIALVELYEARRNCAVLTYEDELARSTDPHSEQLAATYETSLTEATGFHHPAAVRWFGVGEQSITAADEFRARLFAAALREYLRTRYGHRWWDSRKAGDELIDLWNTASRYTLEELASLMGVGALDVELLADALSGVLRED